MKVYVEVASDFSSVVSYHTSANYVPYVECVQDDPIFDVSKIEGYKIVREEDGYHLRFDEEKYTESVLKQQREEAIKNGNKLLSNLVEAKVLRTASNTDAYAMRYLYPTWSGDSVEYIKDDRVMYNDKFYKVLQTHTSQPSWTPDTAVSQFVEIPDPNVEYPEYKQSISAETAYKKGDKITYKDKKYICIAPDGVPCTWSPDEYPAYWQFVEETE